MTLQSGDIGYYTDIFSVCFVTLLAGVTFILTTRRQVLLKQSDTVYCVLANVCAGSFTAAAAELQDYQNLLFVFAGSVFYLGVRHAEAAKSVNRLFVVFILVVLAHAVVQYVTGQRMCAVFSNENYFAGFIGAGLLVMLGAMLDCGVRRIKKSIGYGVLSGLSLAAIVLLRARTALLGVGAGMAIMLMPWLIVYCRRATTKVEQFKARRCLLTFALFTGASVIAVTVAHKLYMIKPLSGAGRLLIWSVAARMAMKAPLLGVGFGNLANSYNLFQAGYFAHGGGSVPQRIAAYPCRQAFNEPLEVAAELGIPGLLILAVFCALIVKEVWEVVKRNGAALRGASVDGASVVGIKYSVKEEQRQEIPQPCRRWRHGADAARDDSGSIRGTEVAPIPPLAVLARPAADRGTEAAPNMKPDYLTLGMAGSVVCFMVMSLFHFPRKVVPTWLVFNYALAWLVTVNQQCKQRVNVLKRSHKTLVVVGWRVFWLLAFVGSAALLPLYVKNYIDARRWIAAHELTVTGEVARAYTVYTELYPKLKWSGRFCAYYGNAIMAASEKSNASARIDGRAARQAVALYEKAKYTYPDPYMFENLAVAYLQLADGTKWPLFMQTQYRMETPVQALKRKLREWRCGTNMFFEPSPTQLTRGNCIGRAVDYLTLASNILPWRLTSRWYLAQIYRDVGDVSNALKYAQLVVNIPMKKDTPQGREFKRKAQKLLNELGVKCDDPGMVVFDIHDRKTWNEGKW